MVEARPGSRRIAAEVIHMSRPARALAAVLALLAFTAGFAAHASAQPPDRKALLETYMAKAKEIAKDDVAGHYQLAVWCRSNGLEKEATRHLNRVIALDPKHTEARQLLGHVFHDGKWMTKEERAKAEEKALAAERAAKGLVKYKDEWVPKEDLEKLKAGFEKVDGEWVSPEDAKAMKEGLVRHPETWEWIKKEDLGKAEKGMFVVGGKWVTKEEADKHHSSWANAWQISTPHYLLTTNLPWDKARPLKYELESVYMRLRNIFETVEPMRAERMNVYVFATPGDYNAYGNEFGDDYSSISGGWFSMADEKQPAVCLWDDNFGKIYLPHALALQYQTFTYAKAGFTAMPYWFVAGVATYCDRFWDASLRKWGCENIVSQGGVANYGKSWFTGFKLAADFVEASQKNLRDAGFLVCYALHGGDEKATALWKGFWEAFKAAKKPNELIKYVHQLEAHFTQSNKDIRNYFQQVLTGK